MNRACWMIEGEEPHEEFIVILPACDRDCQILLRNLDWMRRLDNKLPYTCLVSQDAGMNKMLAAEVLASARETFAECLHFKYPTPRVTGWPQAPNWAFQSTAYYIGAEIGKPWFWMEPDLTPLKPGWLPILQAEYAQCGKPIMGSVVGGDSHVNGTAIYPADFPALVPSAMKSTTGAWDWEMKDEALPLTYDAGHLMFHCWGIVNGKTNPYSGPAASFRSDADVVRWVPPEAVTFHRCKDASLIQRLIERTNASHRHLHPVVS